MSKCLGAPDYSSPKRCKPIIKCDKEAEEGRVWCGDCGNKIMERFRSRWADMAQMEAPCVKRGIITSMIDKILGR